MNGVKNLSRSELAQLPILARVAFLSKFEGWLGHCSLSGGFGNEMNLEQDTRLVWSVLKDLASGKIEANLGLANKIWKAVFNLSIGVKIASTTRDNEDLVYLRVVHACATFLYNSILAIQSHSTPKSMFVARSLDAAGLVLEAIYETSVHRDFPIQKIHDVYYHLQERATIEEWSDETIIPGLLSNADEEVATSKPEPLKTPTRRLRMTIS